MSAIVGSGKYKIRFATDESRTRLFGKLRLPGSGLSLRDVFLRITKERSSNFWLMQNVIGSGSYPRWAPKEDDRTSRTRSSRRSWTWFDAVHSSPRPS